MFGSLFAGIGGFDLGLERAGMRCSWYAEIDQRCNDLMSERKPGIPNLGDVRNVTKETVEPVDVVCGGFPCQDLSIAGKRAGLAGERSGLWFEFHRVLAELGPQWAVVENVPGLLSSNGGRDFAVILRGLAEIGYLSAWRVLDAQYYGVAQRRRRLFIVASLGDGCAAEVLFERESLSWDSAPSREAGEGVAGTIAASAHPGGFNGREAGRGRLVANPLSAHHGRNCGEDTFVPIAYQCQGNNVGPMGTLRRGNGGLTGGVPFVFDSTQITSPCNRSNPKPGDVCHSLSLSGRPPTLAFQSKASASSSGVRRLTPTECERLQGFPDGWTDNGQSGSARYRQLGNAVCVPVVEWIGRRILGIRGRVPGGGGAG